MTLKSINIRLEDDLLSRLQAAAELLSAEKGVRLARADVHRIALRELYARLGVTVAPQAASEQGQHSPPPKKKRKAR